ncbi:MAG: CinA family protein [Candidatus Eutrophobiaceae bacterium]
MNAEFNGLLSQDIPRLVDALAQQCLRQGVRLAVAESCTGGLLAACLNALPGSSKWFECGFVVYSNAAKERMLGVPRALKDFFHECRI